MPGAMCPLFLASRPNKGRAGVHLGGPRQCLRVDILPDVRQFAISNGNGEDKLVLERLIRGFDSPSSDAYELASRPFAFI